MMHRRQPLKRARPSAVFFFYARREVLFRVLLVSRGIGWFQKFRRRSSNFSCRSAFLLSVQDAAAARAASKEL